MSHRSVVIAKTGAIMRVDIADGSGIEISVNIFRKCLVISKISCTFASPLEEMCRRDNANWLTVRGVEASDYA